MGILQHSQLNLTNPRITIVKLPYFWYDFVQFSSCTITNLLWRITAVLFGHFLAVKILFITRTNKKKLISSKSKSKNKWCQLSHAFQKKNDPNLSDNHQLNVQEMWLEIRHEFKKHVCVCVSIVFPWPNHTKCQHLPVPCLHYNY